MAVVTREPLGVVGAVVPWNYPLSMAAWKLAPALAAGNSVVLKPAEQSPYTALRVAALAMEAGLPPGVLNVLPGFGETAGQALGRHMDVDCLTFTGSTEVGKLFMRYAGESNAKRVSLELGGKSPQVVLADCDLDAAAAGVAAGIFANAGQVCNAGSRLVVEEDGQGPPARTHRRRTPARFARATRSTQRRRSAHWSAGNSSTGCSATSTPAGRKAPLSSPAAERRCRTPAAISSSRPCSTACATT